MAVRRARDIDRPRAPEGSEAARRARAGALLDATPWVVTGIAAGVLGATSIALFFLGLDLAAGRPLRTPDLLGAALFQGRLPPPDVPVEAARVLGFTILHGLVFVAFGAIAAFVRMTAARRADARRGLALGGALFAACELVFLAFAGLFEPGLLPRLGLGTVTAANLLAACAMTLFLVVRDVSWRRVASPACAAWPRDAPSSW